MNQRQGASTQPPQRSLSRLTFDAGLQSDPTWSADGRFIAYSSDKSGNFDIWVQPVGGGNAVQVTHAPAHDWQADWSPDDTQIIFRSEREGGGLFVVPALGGRERKISSFGYQPRWSPDGTRILFSNSGGEWTRITEDNGASDKPHWSPDGKAIYFLSNRGTGFFNVWGIHFDSEQGKPIGNPFRVTSFDSPGRMVWPQVGGSEIALSADRLVLPITEVTGNIWVLDGVDR